MKGHPLNYFYILVCICVLLFTSCQSIATNTPKTGTLSPDILPMVTSTLANKVDYLDLASVTPIPTPPYIVEPIGCDSTMSGGHILFLNNILSGIGELHIMDSNACDHHLIMRGVSGSPDWSADGKQIFVGCKENQSICVLNVPATLASCLNTPEENECKPVIIEEYLLPKERNQKNIGNLSWSANGNRLLVPVQDGINIYTYILRLGGEGEWQLIGKNALANCDLSPVSDELICGGIEKISLSSMYIEGYQTGNNPEWSPDGNTFVFSFYQLQDQDNPKERQTIMVWTIGTENIPWMVIREPARFDENNWSRRNVMFNSSFYRRFSWSPDGRYIIFVGNYRNDRDSEIFRLDIQTGEIVVLTTKLGDGHYEAPAWGP